MGEELEIVLNKEGVQGPIRQRPDFLEANHAYCRLFKEHVDEHEEYNYTVHPRTGWKNYPSTCSSSSSQ